jgi:hypothetical protein
MHDTSKTGSFMALRANGWSLAKISKELNISKSTLWEWDNKQQNEIHLLKHLQLEKLQEKYLPTYEEELSKLRAYLDRLELALENQDFSKMGPEYVLQMALQLRARLGKMREQVPLRNVPFNQPLTPLPFTGCVSRQGAYEFRDEYFEGESNEDSTPTNSQQPSVEANQSPHGVPPSGGPSSTNGHANGNAKADPINGSVHSVSCECSVLNPAQPNRTFPDETPPGSQNGTLKINGFHKPDPNGRPVLNSTNGYPKSHVNNAPSEPRTSVSDLSPGPEISSSLNGDPHRHTRDGSSPSGSVHSVSSGSSVLKDPELRDSVVNPAQANRTFPDETPPGSKNGTLKINGFHKPNLNGRPVLNSQNGHPNVVSSEPPTSVSDLSPGPEISSPLIGDPNGHTSDRSSPSDSVHSVSSAPSVLKDTELRDSVVDPPPTQAGPAVPEGWELSDHVSETGVRLAFPKRKL